MEKGSSLVKIFIAACILLLLPGSIYFVCRVLNTQSIQKDINELVKSIPETAASTPADSVALPESVRKYLSFALSDTVSEIRFVRVKENALYKMNLSSGWKKAKGEEYFVPGINAFLRHSGITYMMFVPVSAKELYFRNRSESVYKYFSCIPYRKMEGREAAQTELAGFLLSTVLFPAALMPGRNVRWESSDSLSARAILTDNGITVSALFSFNEVGEVTSIKTDDMYFNWEGDLRKVTHITDLTGYKDFSGVSIPTRIDASWQLGRNKFTYLKTYITEADYSVPYRGMNLKD